MQGVSELCLFLTLDCLDRIEFFMWPSYMTNITPPMQCISRFTDIYGEKMPIRIGGTTQDRATYDPSFDGYVSYTVASPLDAPDTLTYGPRFWDLISKLSFLSCFLSFSLFATLTATNRCI